VPPGQVRTRRAKGAVGFIAALVLLFQAGVTVAHAEEGRHMPQTSTEINIPLAALGGVFVSVGVWLLRRPRETSADP
jgi:LPXTG-motif cell wall-anchored protein